MLQLSRAELLKAYRTMATIRAFEDAVHVACCNGEIPGYVHLCAGQEAAAAGVCIHLKETDYVFGWRAPRSAPSLPTPSAGW